ncbi:MAG TPA: sugar-binding protein, partial [Trueperaceae bacterium]|nr:sugar-binding protein [Trueperaceae bacterium]
ATISWDEDALHLSCRVTDDVHVSDANDEDLYENDSLQVYFDFRPASRQDSTFAPGVAGFILAPDAQRRSVRVEAITGSRELANRDLAAAWFTTEAVEATVEPTGERGGYLLEARFPYASLGVESLRAGAVFRADLSLSDNDGNWYRTHQLVWSGARGYRRCYLRWAYLDPAGYGWVLVVDPKNV